MKLKFTNSQILDIQAHKRYWNIGVLEIKSTFETRAFETCIYQRSKIAELIFDENLICKKTTELGFYPKIDHNDQD